MNKRVVTTSLLLLKLFACRGQVDRGLVDSVMHKHNIPEIAYAIVSSDSILAMGITGVKKIGSSNAASLSDRFHIGSNTKAITSLVAARLVEAGKIRLETKIFDLFPELRKLSRKAYQNITLQDLLTFRGRLPAYTYTNVKPTRKQIKGDLSVQHYQLAKYFLSQKPMKVTNGLSPSNADYIIAGIMLEKVSGKSYRELVMELGAALDIKFEFGYPNISDSLQTWGHDGDMGPIAPFENYKLDWLMAAGNINVALPGYIKFIQANLKGLKNGALGLERKTFDSLMFGPPTFAFGWFHLKDKNSGYTIAYNTGNAGAFITRVEIIKELNLAFIVFTNAASEETATGIEDLLNYLEKVHLAGLKI